MALLTQTAAQAAATVRESMGSMTYIQIPLTTGSTSDTYNVGTNLQVVNAVVEGNSTSAGTSYGGDATYSATTGLVTIISANQGSVDLILYVRN